MFFNNFVNFCNKRAGGINKANSALFTLVGNGFFNPVGANNQNFTVGHFFGGRYNPSTILFQIGNPIPGPSRPTENPTEKVSRAGA